MRLLSLDLKNFRQFAGEQGPLTFAADGKKNATLIFGANGSGKTALLNAFTWCLYRKTTPALAEPDKLVSERALLEAKRGAAVEAFVRVEFEHDGSRFVATRVRRERKTGPGLEREVADEGTLSLTVVDGRGNSRTPDNPEDILSKILPERLHDFFFFDGERIERLTKPRAYAEIEDGIKNLLGLELLDRSTRHLAGEVKKTLEDELRKVGNAELQQHLDDKSAAEHTKLEAEAKIVEEKQNLEAIGSQIEDVKARLRELDETRLIQRELDNLEGQRTEQLGLVSKADDDIQKQISRMGYSAFLSGIVTDCVKVLEESRRRGEIPSGIKRQFVQDLIDSDECICGTTLSESPKCKSSVESWLDRAGLSDVEEAALTVTAQFKNYEEERANFYETLDAFYKKRAEAKALVQRVDEMISEKRSRIGEQQGELIQGLVDRQATAEKQRGDAQNRLGRQQQRVQDAEKTIQETQGKIEKAQAASDKERTIRKRLAVVREAAQFFKGLYDFRTNEVRTTLDQRIRAVYQKISYKPYRPELTNDFHLVLRKGLRHEDEELSITVAQSTGENQILSLAFIGSVVDYARERHHAAQEDPAKEGLGFSGGVFPIVMDSPFGTLDDNYKTTLAEGLPKLADQVVLFVSKSQGLGPVYEAIRGRAGRTYVISYETPKEDAKDETIALDGRSFPYITRKSDQPEAATLLEVK